MISSSCPQTSITRLKMTNQNPEICSLVHKQILPVERGTSAVIGSVFSLAESDTKNANGTSHKQIVKNART